MSDQANVFCGFSDVNGHYLAKNIEQLRDFNLHTAFYPNVNVPESIFRSHRLRFLKYLKTEKNFVGGRKGQKEYLNYFTLRRFKELNSKERKLHTYRNCDRCVTISQFGLKKYNETFIKNRKEQEKQKEICDILITTLKEQQKLKRKASQLQRREILMEIRREEQKVLLSKDTQALYSTTISGRQWDKQRRIEYAVQCKNKKRDPVGPLKSYKCDTKLALKILKEHSNEEKDIKNNLKGKWSELARQVHLEGKGSKNPVKNGGQIMQKFASANGFKFDKRLQKRTTWRKYSRSKGLAVLKHCSYRQIKDYRDKLILNKTIDIGEKVCPTSENRIFYNKTAKKLDNKTITYYARKISLTNIRTKHLKLMYSKGLLRNSPNSMSREELIETLVQFHVKFDLNANEETLRKIVTKEQCTRHMCFWTDHAQILGHTYYVIAVWFLYNDRVYKTSKECGFNVETYVQRPYIHLIARSKSSVADQNTYLIERIKELKTVSTPIAVMGQTYHDVVRFHTGDLPSRLYESGNNITGNYRCICGSNINNCHLPSKLFMTGPFQNLKDRIKHANKSTVLGKCVDKMKKSELENELITRGVDWDYDGSPSKLKQMLKADLKGVKCLPPLASKGFGLNEINCEELEIMRVDPLHDFRNLIQNILIELPSCAPKNGVGGRIKDFCSNINDQRHQLRGCDYRLALVNLVLLLQDRDFQMDQQCRNIYNALFPLVEIQKLAYQRWESRTTKDILRLNLMALKFATNCQQVFKNKTFYGAPFHCITTHMAECYRLVSLRSTVTEAAERQFNDIRQLSRSTNSNVENLLNNLMVRFHYQHIELNTIEEVPENKVNEITDNANNIDNNKNTIWTKQFVKNNKIAVLSTCKRISDLLLEGENVWYKCHGDSIEFRDGPLEEIDRHTCLSRMDFRSHSLKSMHEELESTWQKCLNNSKNLNLKIIEELTS